jgi:hypothetical protein
MALLNFQHSQEELWRTGCGEDIYRRDTPKGHNQTGFNLLNLSTLKLVIRFGEFFSYKDVCTDSKSTICKIGAGEAALAPIIR